MMTREELSTMQAIQNINRKLPELRDLFAMSVIQTQIDDVLFECSDEIIEEMAKQSYKVAEAMLEARKK